MIGKSFLLKILLTYDTVMHAYSATTGVSESVTRWTTLPQAPLSIGFSRQRILEWIAMASSRGSNSRPLHCRQIL